MVYAQYSYIFFYNLSSNKHCFSIQPGSYHHLIAAERQRGSSLIWTCFTRPSLSRLSYIVANLDLCLSVCQSDFSAGYFYGTRGSGLYGVCMCFFKQRIAKKKVQKTVRKLKGKYYYMANLHIAGTFH